MEPWAQLVSTTDIDSDPIAIIKQKFIIGRAQGTDLCFSSNKLVSGLHCFIERDDNGKIWLQDTSTNGTLLNKNTKVSGQRVALAHGDEIFIVYRKSEADLTVSFLFQVTEDLKREALETTDEGSFEMDQTQKYEENFSETVDAECLDTSPTDDLKRKISSTKNGDGGCEPMAKKLKCHASKDTNGNKADGGSLKCQGKEMEEKVKLGNHADVTDEKAVKEKASSDQKFGEEPKSSDLKSAEGQVTAAAEPNASKNADDLMNFMEDELVCSICQDILHNAVSVQPCLHTFCAGCYSGWMKNSRDCPWCRRKVNLISKNHMTNNIVEAYLKAHPEKRRSLDDLKELDEKNEIKEELMEPLLPDDELENSEDEAEVYSENGSEDDAGPPAPAVPYYPFNPVQYPPNPAVHQPWNVIRPLKTVCRQCPEYFDQHPAMNDATQNAAVGRALDNGACTCGGACVPGACIFGGTSGAPAAKVKSSPVAPEFTCPANQNHIMCQCCWAPMPHRKWERTEWNLIPPQECVLCHKAFCHLYWGCRATCDGCINIFEETVFRPQVLDSIILKNKYESSGLKTYLNSRGLLVHDFFMMCLHRLKNGLYTCSGQDFILRPDSAVCYTCALEKFSELAYQFRKDIQDDMPDAFKNRANCYWGRNCSTQMKNEVHAQRFNHVCEASRMDARP